MTANKRRIAIIAGVSFIIMVKVAGATIGYAYAEFDKPEQFDLLKDTILQKGKKCTIEF